MQALMPGPELLSERELRSRLATTQRVAEEAMKLLSREQLAELRRRLDALEGDRDSEHSTGDRGDSALG